MKPLLQLPQPEFVNFAKKIFGEVERKPVAEINALMKAQRKLTSSPP